MEMIQSVIDSLLGSLDLSQVSTLDMAKFLLWVGIAQVVLRVAAEALMRFAVHTENTWDNKLAELLSNVTWYLGAFLGRFGFGTPQPHLQDQVEQAVAKEKAE